MDSDYLIRECSTAEPNIRFDRTFQLRSAHIMSVATCSRRISARYENVRYSYCKSRSLSLRDVQEQ